MRVLAIAIVLSSGVAHADWDEEIALARIGDDAGRPSLGTLAGAGIGDGGGRDTSAGGRGTFSLTGDVVLGAELRDLTPGLRSTRTAAASIDLGYVIATSKLAAGDDVVRMDLIASAGGGAVWTDTATAADRAHGALTFGLAARVHLSERAVLELGVHDDLYRDEPAAADGVLARAIAPPSPVLESALEVRASLAWMFGSTYFHCVYVVHHAGRRNPLDNQPAL